VKFGRAILKVNDTKYSGWKNISINRAIDKASSTFDVTVSRLFDTTIDFIPGTACQVWYDNNLLITGYIDKITESYSGDEHTTTIVGRSKTKDLVDCSTEIKQTTTPQTVLQIATSLAAPYGVKVEQSNITDDKPINQYQPQTDGESVFRAIERIAETRQMVVTDTPTGNLLLTRASSTLSGNKIVQKKDDPTTNVLSGEYSIDESNNYQKVIVKGQGKGSDTDFGKSVSSRSSVAVNTEVTRQRVLVVTCDTDTSQQDLDRKAQWEITNRAAKAVSLKYTIPSWYGPAGIWRENTLVEVDDDLFDIHRNMLIGEIVYTISDQGTYVDLTLFPPEAFLPEPTRADQKKHMTTTSKKTTQKKSTKTSGESNSESFEVWDAKS
jgi:prophage tail gpP-like protein